MKRRSFFRGLFGAAAAPLAIKAAEAMESLPEMPKPALRKDYVQSPNRISRYEAFTGGSYATVRCSASPYASAGRTWWDDERCDHCDTIRLTFTKTNCPNCGAPY